MYCYLYDSFLRDRRYESTVNRIEARVAELGLQGKVERLTILKSVSEIIASALKRGVDTFVVVGDDTTVAKVLGFLASTPVTMGLIPVGPRQTVASLLGIPSGASACDTLSKRVVRHLDLGRANAQYFLLSLEVSRPAVTLESDLGYTISSVNPTDRIAITNFPLRAYGLTASQTNPEDGRLEVVFVPRPTAGFGFFQRNRGRGASVFPVHRLKITSQTESVPLLVDGESIVKTPVTVEVAPRSLKAIVGRDRTF